jgi:general secretion pathway protein C
MLGFGTAAVFGAVVWSARSQPEPEKDRLAVSNAALAPAALVAARPADRASSILGTDSSISASPLQLILVATAPGKSPKEGTASLGTDERNPQTYAAGAMLVNGAIIEQIYRDHVVLEFEGMRTSLAIGEKAVGRNVAQQTGKSNRAATVVGGAESVNRPLESLASSREDLAEILRPEPVFEAEKFAGLRILPGRNSGKLEALGLKPGDIVRTIDGKPMVSADAGWQILDDNLSTGSTVVVSIEREGTLSSVYLDGSRIIEPAIQASSTSIAGPHPGS